MILASCSYEDSKKYHNKLVLVTEKESKKPEEVHLNIVTDDPDMVLKSGVGTAKCVTSKVRPTVCPDNMKGNVFHEIPYEEFTGVSEVDGVVCLVRFPEGFCDMRKVEEICQQGQDYDDVEAKVRVTGGNFLEISGVSIGRYNKGKEKMSAVFNGIYDMFAELPLDSIEVKEVMSKVRSVSSSSKSKKSSSGSSNSKAKKAETFAKFFGDSDGGF